MTTAAATARARANKRKGSQHQSDIRNMLRDAGFDVEILELSGKEDEGDLVVRLQGKRHVIIEAKNVQKIDLPRFMREAQVEADNFAKHRPAVDREGVLPVAIVKARGQNVRDAYVVVRAGDFFGYDLIAGVK